MSKLPPNPWLKPIRDVLLTGLALVGLYYVLEVVVYFLAAAALTLLGRPIHTLLRSVRISRRWGVSSSAAALITVLGFFALLAGLLWLIVPPVVSQVVALSNTDPHKMVEALQEPLNALYKQLDKWGLGSEANEIIHSAVADLRANLLNSGLLASLIALVEDIGSTLIGIFSIGFMAFFFLKEPGTLGRIFITLVPSVFDQRMEEALVKLKTQLRRYFLGLLGQTAIFTTLLTSSLYLLGFRDALLIGLIGGILNLIPYLGPMIGGAFGILLFVAGNITMPFPFLQEGILILIAVFLGCQAVDNLFVSTLIFSNTLKTHPLEIFVVSLVAGILGGVVGMVIAIPCYTAVRVFLKEFMPENRFVKALSS